MRQKKVIVIDDNSNMLYGAPGNMTRRLYERYLECLAETRADIVTVDLASPDLCYYKSKVDDWWGKHATGEDASEAGWTCPNIFWNVFHNFKSLIGAGEDPGEIIFTTLHRQGLTVAANFRTNDLYGHPALRTRWENQHPEWVIPDKLHFDYAIPQVREHRLAIAQEIVDDYDVDALQLDFVRGLPVLSSPDHADLLTDFVRGVRDHVEKASRHKGKKILLGVILPWEMAVLERNGIDYKTWIKEGFFDYVVPAERSYAEWNIRVAPWVELVRGTNCEVYPVVFGVVGDKTILSDENYSPKRANLTMPQIRACAVNFYNQGADGIAFYNFYQGDHRDKFPMLGELRDPEALTRHARHYFYCKIGEYANHDWLRIKLAAQADPDERKTFRFYIGEKLTKDTAVLAFKAVGMCLEDELIVDINGAEIPPEAWTLPDPLESIPTPTGVETRASGLLTKLLLWRTPIGSPPLHVGENEIGIRRTRTSAMNQEITIAEIEILGGELSLSEK